MILDFRCLKILQIRWLCKQNRIIWLIDKFNNKDLVTKILIDERRKRILLTNVTSNYLSYANIAGIKIDSLRLCHKEDLTDIFCSRRILIKTLFSLDRRFRGFSPEVISQLILCLYCALLFFSILSHSSYCTNFYSIRRSFFSKYNLENIHNKNFTTQKHHNIIIMMCMTTYGEKIKYCIEKFLS